jgi:steroid 5-alpha reductase family enzyme
MSVWQLAGLAWLVSAVAMVATWAFAMRVRNIGYVDVAWAGLMAIAAVLVATLSDGSILARALVAAMGGLWGARLCLYLLRRVAGEDEDGRYRALRDAWSGSPLRFFVFFQMQALVVALFSLPFIAAAGNPEGRLDGWMAAAIVVWVVAVAGEWLADRQLSIHRRNPANRGVTCRSGLWGWSRHPNYFFEWLHWFAYVLLAVGAPHAWLAWIGPLVMLAFLYRVSGIPWTEQQALRSRGDDYRRYQREVSAFIPRPPRRDASGADA